MRDTPTKPADSPEWLRPAQVPRLFPISRATLYNLISDGSLITKVLRRPGCVKGIRLINTESIRKLIDAQPSA